MRNKAEIIICQWVIDRKRKSIRTEADG